MDLVGQYLRLRRELLRLDGPADTDRGRYLHRVGLDLQRAAKRLEVERSEDLPFLDTLPCHPSRELAS